MFVLSQRCECFHNVRSPTYGEFEIEAIQTGLLVANHPYGKSGMHHGCCDGFHSVARDSTTFANVQTAINNGTNYKQRSRANILRRSAKFSRKTAKILRDIDRQNRILRKSSVVCKHLEVIRNGIRTCVKRTRILGQNDHAPL